MIKHIVLFQFKNGKKNSTDLELIKKSLEDLVNFIPELKSIEVGINSNPKEMFDLALTTEFESWEDLNSYVVHPEHQKVSTLIRAALDQRACVDYEF